MQVKQAAMEDGSDLLGQRCLKQADSARKGAVTLYLQRAVRPSPKKP